MKILVTGGGSGGHITPILAVAHELKQLRPEAEIIYVGQTGDRLLDVPEQDPNIDRVLTIRAGKFRRYHGEGLKQLLDIVTLYKNLRDAIWTLVGVWQSFKLLGQIRPDVIFVKGGFVGVPVGLAAALRGIPFVTHDSDALPGLANRLIARWAKVHAVALPKEVYAIYPPKKTVTVGVPIPSHFHLVSKAENEAWRKQLDLDDADQVVFVTGGGNGADRLNKAVMGCAPELLERYPGLKIVHVTGRQLEDDARRRYKQLLSQGDQGRVTVKGFISNLYQYSGVADVVITRAGATSMAEFAAQAKACIVVPNPQLTGGHQLKNAKVMADRKAIRLVSEENLKNEPRALMPALTELLDHPAKARALGEKLAELAQPNAAHLLAMVLLEVAEGSPRR
ncbi:MAG TPA: UDP-N-acetylglucosamine--N-acetylmuramyl-(pentapeptide) pyrophosphoryl-undecaprenol N-acetylglucosamine transferase [Candidatus Pristimantibacillus sp.]|nr:UDP-N-acetylglucosamine--N-acetylmuramyl-(pentapeptide) pyrophosphoryl-undecaprenol N-acetylglucosamine transferase [Candidatus Pristimantibacillus sp.]